MNRNKSLNIRNFVLMGIFSAIMFALAMLLMMVIGVTPAIYLFYLAVYALVCGPLYMKW